MNRIPKQYLKALTNVCFGIVVVCLCIWILPRILWFFMPFVIGWLLSLLANPLVHFFEDKIKMKRKAGTALVIVSVIGVICLGLYAVGVKLVKEAYGLFTSLPEIWESTERDVQWVWSKWGGVINRLPEDAVRQVQEFSSEMGQSFSGMITDLSGPTVDAVGSFAKNLPGILIGTIMCLLSAYFFVAEKEYLHTLAERYCSESTKEKARLMKNTLYGAIGGYFKAQIKIEVWIYLITAVGFLLLDIEYAFLTSLVIALMDILPILGTGIVLIPWAILKFLSGQYSFGIGLLLIWGGGLLIRQIIQPKIVGDSIGMPPIPTLLLLYAGYKFAGVLGMIVAVPLGILVQTMNESGLFDGIKASFLLLWRGFNRFRRLEGKEKDEEKF